MFTVFIYLFTASFLGGVETANELWGVWGLICFDAFLMTFFFPLRRVFKG